MQQEKIKIFVACHKPCEVEHNDVYVPIHVGREISKCKDEMVWMIGDDTGDNISLKNPFYCELTAQYWVWKNVHDAEYVGFCHYRRYFNQIFTKENIDKHFDNADVLMVGPRFRPYTRLAFLNRFVSNDDIHIMFLVVQKLYPDYYKTMCSYAWDFYDYPSNMLVCKKTIFDDYAKWLFDVLFECEKHLRLSPYSRARRVYGYMSEFLMNVYFLHNKYRIKGVSCLAMDKNKILRFSKLDKIKYFIFRHLIFFKSTEKDFPYNPAVLLGLKNDGIIINKDR